MLSLALATLLVLPFLVGLLLLVGSSVKWIVGALVRRSWRDPFPIGGDPLLALAEDFALGAAVIPLLFLEANLVAIPLVAGFSVGIFLVCMSVTLYRLYLLRAVVGQRIVGLLGRSRWEVAILLAAVFAGLAVRLVPYANLWVLDGSDIQQYTLLAQSIVTDRALPTGWGSYAYASWNQLNWTNNHLLFTGSESLFAFLSFFVPLDLPQLTSASVLLLNAAIPVMGYALVRALFPKAPPLASWCTAVLLAVVAAYPLFFEQWGGIDEITGWVVVLGFIVNFMVAKNAPTRNWGREILGALFLGGLLFITPIGFAYAFAFLLAYGVEALLRRVRWGSALGSCALQLGLGLLLVAPLFAEGIHNVYRNGNSPGATGWGSFATAPILRYGDWTGSLFRLVTLTSFFYSFPLVVAGAVGLCLLLLRRQQFPHGPLVVMWAGLLFLLNENGPYGLFLVRYPGWTALFPDRMAEFLMFLMTIPAGLVVSFLWERASRKGPEVTPEVRSRLAHRRGNLKRTAATVLLAALLLGVGVESGETMVANQQTVPWASSLSSADLTAFGWLEVHVPKGSTILLSGAADAGTWIPEFEGLRVYPYTDLITNESVFSNYDAMAAQLSNPAYPEFSLYSGLGRAYNLTYAYFGGKHAFNVSNLFSVEALVDAPPVTGYITSLQTGCPTGSNLSVLLCQDNDSVTVAGPIVLNVTVSHGSSPTGSYFVPVPANVTFTYVNQEYTPSWPGSWSTRVSAVPPGNVVYRSSNQNVFVVQLDGAYFATACSDLPALGSCGP